MHRHIVIAVVVMLITGCSKPSNEFDPKKYDTKRYSDRDLNAAVLRSVVAHRTGRALAQMQVLKQLRSGSVTNAIDMLEAELAKDVQQLQTILKNADETNSYRGQIQGTLGRFDEYRARYPVIRQSP